MKKIYSCIFLLLFLIASDYVKAQDSGITKKPVYKKQYSTGIEFTELFNGGLKLNYEFRIKKTRQWLRMDVAGYYLPNYSDNMYYYYGWNTFSSGFDTFESLKGAGLNTSYKIFPLKREWLYFSGGLSYRYFKVGYYDYDSNYVPFTEDGMTFYRVERVKHKQDFNKLGANLCIGMQTTMRSWVIFDSYIGLGYTYSFYDADKTSHYTSIFGFGHRGVTLVFGARLAFSFGRYRID